MMAETLQQKAERIKAHMAKHPGTTRNRISKGTGITYPTMEECEALGLVTLPAKVPNNSKFKSKFTVM